MKSQLTINTVDYEIEINVKKLTDSCSTDVEAKRVINYLMTMAFEASENSKSDGRDTMSREYLKFACDLHNTLVSADNHHGWYIII